MLVVCLGEVYAQKDGTEKLAAPMLATSEYGIRKFRLTGGEPTLRRRYGDIFLPVGGCILASQHKWRAHQRKEKRPGSIRERMSSVP